MSKETIKIEVVAGVVVKSDDKYLLVQEKQPHVYGQWNLPAGKVDLGETLEQAAIREAKEESGYEVELIRKIAVVHDSATDVVKHAFEAKIVGGELCVQEEEIMDAKWFSLEEIKEMKDKIRGGWALDMIDLLE